MRETKKSVTCFLQFGKKYLFVHRTKKNNDVDANRLNGIGGKLELGENFLQAAVRETQEETGYVVSPSECSFSGIISLTGGYEQDWVICFFVIPVSTMDIPSGITNTEGNLIWIEKDAVLNSEYELVDDLNYLWKHITDPTVTFFAASQMDEKEKVENIAISLLPRN